MAQDQGWKDTGICEMFQYGHVQCKIHDAVSQGDEGHYTEFNLHEFGKRKLIIIYTLSARA